MCHCTEYKLSALQVRISEENNLSAAAQEFMTAKFWLRVEKREQNTLITASKQFTTAK